MMKKSAAKMKKSPAKMAKKSPAKMMKKSPAKMAPPKSVKKGKPAPQEKAAKIAAKRGAAFAGNARANIKYKGNDPKEKARVAAMKKSPAKKALVGKQKNLPKELRDKILASPAKMLKPAAMKLMKKSPAKMNYKKK